MVIPLDVSPHNQAYGMALDGFHSNAFTAGQPGKRNLHEVKIPAPDALLYFGA